MKITDEVKTQLLAIAAKRNGRLTPDDVVADAKRKDSPLHAMFEWDVKKAAAQHWVDTARAIIGSVEVRVTMDHITVRVPFYVRDPSAKSDEQGYIAVSALSRDHDSARVAIINEFQRAADQLRRARHLAMALGLANEIDGIVASIVDLRDRVKHAAPEASM